MWTGPFIVRARAEFTRNMIYARIWCGWTARRNNSGSETIFSVIIIFINAVTLEDIFITKHVALTTHILMHDNNLLSNSVKYSY